MTGDLLLKTDSGVSKQTVKPRTWTYVSYAGKKKFAVSVTAGFIWKTFMRVEFPAGYKGTTVKGRFVRFPGTTKIDETGHESKNTVGWAGQTEHLGWCHPFDANPKMPVGFWIWHDGNLPLILDGRQVKADKLG